MIHVGLRILVWVLVLGIGYLVFGPQLFDSSDHANPFDNRAELFLPPAKTQREGHTNLTWGTFMQGAVGQPAKKKATRKK